MALNDKRISAISIVQLLAGMALFGTATPLSKIIGHDFPVFSASFLRMAIASLVLAPFVWMSTTRFKETSRSDFVVVAAIAGFGMVGFTATMLFGMRMTTGVIGSTIMSATPAVTALAAVFFLGAGMNWRSGGALALAVAGIAAINLLNGGSHGSGGDAIALGAALVIVAVCFEAAYTLLSRKLSSGITSIEATLAASMMAAPVFVLLALAFDPVPFALAGVRPEGWAALVFWGAMTGGLAPVLWYKGVRQAPAVLSAGAMSVMPVTSLVTSYLLLGEAFRWSHLIGFGLVFAGLMLMIFERAEARD